MQAKLCWQNLVLEMKLTQIQENFTSIEQDSNHYHNIAILIEQVKRQC